MKIATYVDEEGTLSSLYAKGHVLVYDNAVGAWKAGQDIPFEIVPEMTLGTVKSALGDLAAQLGDCRVLLSGERRGLVYSLLQEEMGFHIWTSQGPALERLDVISSQEADRIAQEEQAAVKTASETSCALGCCGKQGGPGRSACTPTTAPSLERIGSGHYRIDLARVLESDPNLNSRQVLIPVMEETVFETLEILCDHVPRWFSRALDEMNMRAEFDGTAQGLKVLVSPNR